MGLEYESVVVTPEVAEEWLETMGVNRKISESNLDAITQAMREGNWHNDGTPVRFDTDGKMVDGQHRCMAISITGITQTLLVVRGVKPEAMTTIDTGKSRTRPDIISIHDPSATNVTQVASAGTGIARWEMGARGTYLRNTYLSNDAFIKFYDENKEAIVAANKTAIRVNRVHRSASVQALSICAFLFHRIDAEDAKFFWDRLVDGAGMEKGNPILALRRFFEREKSSTRDRTRTHIIVALTIKAWNAYREGRNIELIAFKPGGAAPERFPEPV